MIANLLARFFARPRVADYIIRRAMCTPYRHLPGYMERYWLFNPYGEHAEDKSARFKWLPSVRVHHILRADEDRAMHDHPWDARTMILRGWYWERRLHSVEETSELRVVNYDLFHRQPGHTAAIRFGEFHSIDQVSVGGVWTLFFTWKYRGMWGFDVDGVKVPWRDYLAQKENRDESQAS